MENKLINKTIKDAALSSCSGSIIELGTVIRMALCDMNDRLDKIEALCVHLTKAPKAPCDCTCDSCTDKAVAKKAKKGTTPNAKKPAKDGT